MSDSQGSVLRKHWWIHFLPPPLPPLCSISSYAAAAGDQHTTESVLWRCALWPCNLPASHCSYTQLCVLVFTHLASFFSHLPCFLCLSHIGTLSALFLCTSFLLPLCLVHSSLSFRPKLNGGRLCWEAFVDTSSPCPPYPPPPPHMPVCVSHSSNLNFFLMFFTLIFATVSLPCRIVNQAPWWQGPCLLLTSLHLVVSMVKYIFAVKWKYFF